VELLMRIDRRLAPVLAGSGAHAAPHIVGAFCEAMGWACGTLWTRDAEVADRLACWGAWGVDAPGIAEFLQYTQGRRPILNNAGIVGSAWLGAAPVWVGDITTDDTFRRVPIALRAGLRSALALPVMAGTQVLGVIELYGATAQPRDDALLAGLGLLGGQVAQFVLRVQAQAQLLESEKRLRSLTALSSDWFWEMDAQLRFVRFEGRGITKSGAEMAPAWIGRRLWEVPGLVPGGDWDEQRARLERREPLRDFEAVLREGGGELIHISAQGDPIHDAAGQFTGYRGTARDTSAHKQAAQRIQYLSTHDELTGLPNRAALRQLVAQAIELAKRYERCFAVLLLDVDRFQRMNDSLGRDVVARLDGDEFAVLAHELPAAQQAETIARKLLDALAAPLQLPGHGEFRITASAGIASYPVDASDERMLMQQAGLALRAAKRAGMGQVRCAGANAQPGSERSTA
jgi:PAS domain S-box-containing protein